MSKLKSALFFIKLVIIFCLFLSYTNALGVKNNVVQYKVQFDYENYPEEREIIYRYLLKVDEFDADHPLQKHEIGINLYDINDDGKEEILVYLTNLRYCGSHGCNFNIYKKINNLYYTILCDGGAV